MLWILPAAVLLLSGCSLPGAPGGGSTGTEQRLGAVLKSSDGGKTFESKVRIDDQTNIAAVEVLSMAVNPEDTRNIFLGTRENGIYVTDDGAENWRNLDFPPQQVYGLTVDTKNPRRVFATGTWQNRGKIYRSEDAGGSWKEIYTEPNDGTMVTALMQGRSNTNVLYAGTSSGVIIKTVDGGETWKNVSTDTNMGQAPVTSIVSDTAREDIVYFAARGQGLFLTVDGGERLASLQDAMRDVTGSANIFSLTADPVRPGTVYAGTDRGVFRGSNYGRDWSELNTIESSRKFPIRSIAVNPKNYNEITYSAALAVYRSTDGGARWSTYQLTGDRIVGAIRYDAANPSTVYLGLRNP
jgi:photosystem II stability/assembly factor-like uncharacterized protein